MSSNFIAFLIDNKKVNFCILTIPMGVLLLATLCSKVILHINICNIIVLLV